MADRQRPLVPCACLVVSLELRQSHGPVGPAVGHADQDWRHVEQQVPGDASCRVRRAALVELVASEASAAWDAEDDRRTGTFDMGRSSAPCMDLAQLPALHFERPSDSSVAGQAMEITFISVTMSLPITVLNVRHDHRATELLELSTHPRLGLWSWYINCFMPAATAVATRPSVCWNNC